MGTPFARALGLLLEAKRKEREFGQKDMGLCQSRLSRIETGETPVGLEEFLGLCHRLGVINPVEMLEKVEDAQKVFSETLTRLGEKPEALNDRQVEGLLVFSLQIVLKKGEH